jgi:hypothetical protein
MWSKAMWRGQPRRRSHVLTARRCAFDSNHRRFWASIASMDALTELAWRDALQTRGKEWVVSELRTRPGRADDVLLDVVFEPPHPTRSFCEQWCAEQDNKIFHLSWQSVAAIAALVLVVICFWQAVGSWNYRELMAAHENDVLPRVAPERTGSSGSSESDFSPSLPKTSSPADSSSNPTAATTPPSLCSYIGYDTTRCPKVQP